VLGHFDHGPVALTCVCLGAVTLSCMYLSQKLPRSRPTPDSETRVHEGYRRLPRWAKSAVAVETIHKANDASSVSSRHKPWKWIHCSRNWTRATPSMPNGSSSAEKKFKRARTLRDILNIPNKFLNTSESRDPWTLPAHQITPWIFPPNDGKGWSKLGKQASGFSILRYVPFGSSHN
jgi:hypothetical protein